MNNGSATLQTCAASFADFAPDLLYKRVLATRLHKFYTTNTLACDAMPNFDKFAQMVSAAADLSESDSRRGEAIGQELLTSGRSSFSLSSASAPSMLSEERRVRVVPPRPGFPALDHRRV